MSQRHPPCPAFHLPQALALAAVLLPTCAVGGVSFLATSPSSAFRRAAAFPALTEGEAAAVTPACTPVPAFAATRPKRGCRTTCLAGSCPWPSGLVRRVAQGQSHRRPPRLVELSGAGGKFSVVILRHQSAAFPLVGHSELFEIMLFPLGVRASLSMPLYFTGFPRPSPPPAAHVPVIFRS